VTRTRDNVPLILTAAFVLLVLALNVQLFTQPVVETTDFAANSLLVQQARHFTLLTGHYSRWRFHHPGPAFLYLFALGEFLFHDVLHIVPAPYNAQVLIMIVFNGVLLGAALYIFRRNAELSVPLALLATLVVSVIVNVTSYPRSYPPMLISNWMPDVMVFPFLLFAVSAASVLAGQTRGLPWMAFSGMLLIHAHIVQFLFVGVIGGAAVAYILVRARREAGLGSFVSERRRYFAMSAAIVVLFALPVLLETALHQPNNLQAVLAYSHRFGTERNSLRIALDYSACFLLFIGAPETAVPKGLFGLVVMGLSRTYVVAYWVALALLFILAVAARRKLAKEWRPAPFLGYLTWIWVIGGVLFIYWATRIVGGLFAFNGHFVYALHLLAWFLLLAEIEPYLKGRAGLIVNVLALAGLLVFAVVERKALRSNIRSEPDAQAAAAVVPASRFGTLAITFAPENWGPAIELANSMQRMGKPFCVSPDWGFMFSTDNVCPDLPAADKLSVSTAAAPCQPPCRSVYRSAAFSVTRSPAQWATLPVETGPRGSPGLDRIGFNEPGGPSYAWTQKHASILFKLSPEPLPTPCLRLAITGFALPDRPAQLIVNGRTLGTLSKNALDTTEFVVPRDAIRLGESNAISLDTPGADAVGTDKREIGFAFAGLVLRAARPDESCLADSPPVAPRPRKP
jgi:hypothetical protein